MDKEDSIVKLKEKYSILEKKYSLPKFEELNREFAIEKSEKDSEFLLREIIHFIIDKFQNYIRFLENLINPTNASIFGFSIMKTIDQERKTKLSEAYKKLSEIEMKLIKLDLRPSEEKEAEFIKESFKMWKTVREEIYEVIEFVEKNWDNKQEQNKKNYFG